MIGIFDSGVGGLSIYSELMKYNADLSVVYLSDHANFPYGEKSQEELIRIADEATKKLVAFGANPIVVACNSATVSTINYLREQYPEINFVGVEPAVKVATGETKVGKIGVLATKKTVNTHDSQALCGGKEVYKHFSPQLIEKIENDIENLSDGEIEIAADPLAQMGIDTLVLGCTHFYFIKDRFEKLLPNIRIVEPSRAVARRVMEVAGDLEIGESKFLTTGKKSDLELFLQKFFGRRNYDIREV